MSELGSKTILSPQQRWSLMRLLYISPDRVHLLDNLCFEQLKTLPNNKTVMVQATSGDGVDIFYVPAILDGPRRKSSIIRKLFAIVIDIDSATQQQAYAVSQKLSKLLRVNSLGIVFSGRGYHIYIPIDNYNDKDRALLDIVYKKVIEYVQSKFSTVKVDTSCSYMPHLFRLPGSINSRSNQRCQVLQYPIGKVDFEQLCSIFISNNIKIPSVTHENCTRQEISIRGDKSIPPNKKNCSDAKIESFIRKFYKLPSRDEYQYAIVRVSSPFRKFIDYQTEKLYHIIKKSLNKREVRQVVCTFYSGISLYDYKDDNYMAVMQRKMNQHQINHYTVHKILGNRRDVRKFYRIFNSVRIDLYRVLEDTDLRIQYNKHRFPSIASEGNFLHYLIWNSYIWDVRVKVKCPLSYKHPDHHPSAVYSFAWNTITCYKCNKTFTYRHTVKLFKNEHQILNKGAKLRHGYKTYPNLIELATISGYKVMPHYLLTKHFVNQGNKRNIKPVQITIYNKQKHKVASIDARINLKRIRFNFSLYTRSNLYKQHITSIYDNSEIINKIYNMLKMLKVKTSVHNNYNITFYTRHDNYNKKNKHKENITSKRELHVLTKNKESLTTKRPSLHIAHFAPKFSVILQTKANFKNRKDEYDSGFM